MCASEYLLNSFLISFQMCNRARLPMIAGLVWLYTKIHVPEKVKKETSSNWERKKNAEKIMHQGRLNYVVRVPHTLHVSTTYTVCTVHHV